MSDVPQVHTGEPLVPISDDEIADRAVLPSWTLTEALFWLGGYRSPGYESTRHMQDHFWDAYTQAVRSIEIGDLCRKIERAGEPCFIDRPVRWLAWADSIGPEYIKVDERVRRALSQKANRRSTPKGLTHPNRRGRKKGSGSYDPADALLLAEMKRLLDAGEAVSLQKAAAAVVDKAVGGGTDESKIKRLVKKYGGSVAPQ